MYKSETLSQTVAVVVPYKFIPPMNGGQKVCYEFCLALSKHIEVLCLSTKQEGVDHKFEVVELFEQSIKKYLNLSLISNLVRLFRGREVSAVHCAPPILCLYHLSRMQIG